MKGSRTLADFTNDPLGSQRPEHFCRAGLTYVQRALDSFHSHDWVREQQVGYLDGSTATSLQSQSVLPSEVSQLFGASHRIGSPFGSAG